MSLAGIRNQPGRVPGSTRRDIRGNRVTRYLPGCVHHLFDRMSIPVAKVERTDMPPVIARMCASARSSI